jgi:ACR3 family arsenite efflux pump ArsB
MDHSRHGNRHHFGQLRTIYWTSIGEGKVRWSIGTNWYVKDQQPTLDSSKLMTLLAIGLLVMMYPILCKVRYESLHHLLAQRSMWKQITFSIIINWIIAPFLMVPPPRFWRRSCSGHIY